MLTPAFSIACSPCTVYYASETDKFVFISDSSIVVPAPIQPTQSFLFGHHLRQCESESWSETPRPRKTEQDVQHGTSICHQR